MLQCRFVGERSLLLLRRLRLFEERRLRIRRGQQWRGGDGSSWLLARTSKSVFVVPMLMLMVCLVVNDIARRRRVSRLRPQDVSFGQQQQERVSVYEDRATLSEGTCCVYAVVKKSCMGHGLPYKPGYI